MAPVESDNDKIARLRDLYSKELLNQADSPIKKCLQLILESATIKNDNLRQENLNTLSHELSRFLTDSKGVQNLFEAVLDLDPTSQISTTHNQRFMALATIITRMPNLCMKSEDYFCNISQQLLPLLTDQNDKYSLLAGLIFKSILESTYLEDQKLREKIEKSLFEGLQKKDSNQGLKASVIIISKLISSKYPIHNLAQTFPQLFYISLAAKSFGEQTLRSIAQECLVEILSKLEVGPACCLIEQSILYRRDLIGRYRPILEEPGIEIVDDSDIGIGVSQATSDVTAEIIYLLKRCNSNLLMLEFFFHFQGAMWSNHKKPELRGSCASLLELLLQEKDLASLFESNIATCDELIYRLLLNYAEFLTCDLDEDSILTQKLAIPSIANCTGILEVLVAISTKPLPLMDNFRSILKQILELLTKWIEVDESNTRKLIDDISARLDILKDKSQFEKTNTLDDLETGSMLESVLKELNDHLEPVRVHALIRIKQLIISNDRYTVDQIHTLFSMVSSALGDKESFVYLAAINLISLMGLRKTDLILPELMSAYADESLRIQHRMNIGEVLVRISRKLHQTAPHYAKVTIVTLLDAVKDKEEIMRVSALTNLGELCRSLGDSLGLYMLEILDRLAHVVSNDSILVKTAAMDLLRTTLSGLDGLQVESIQRELKSIYNLLKFEKQRSLDPTLNMQAELAMNELDRLAKELLGLDGEERQLVKEIKVLSL